MKHILFLLFSTAAFAQQGAGGATINNLIRQAGLRPGRWKE